MNNPIRFFIEVLISVTIICFFVAIISQTVIGIIDIDTDKSACQEKPKRIEKVFFGYRAGCWLGERYE